MGEVVLSPSTALSLPAPRPTLRLRRAEVAFWYDQKAVAKQMLKKVAHKASAALAQAPSLYTMCLLTGG